MAKDLNSAIAGIEKELNVFFKPEVIRTGIVSLDIVLNGGLETGSLLELSGDSQTGKSTLLLDVSKRLCDKGYRVCYIDSEGSVKDDIVMGVGLQQYKCTPEDPNNRFLLVRESGYRETEKLIKTLLSASTDEDRITFFVLDSVTALSLDIYIDASSDRLGTEDRVAVDPLMVGKFYKQLNALKTKYACTFLVTNQLRTNMSGYVSTTKTTGGYASSFYPDVKLTMKKKSLLTTKVQALLVGDVEAPYGAEVTIEARKSRLGAGYIPYPMRLIFKKGISNLYSYFLLAPSVMIDVNGQELPLLEKKSSVSYVLHLPSGEYSTSRGQEAALKLVTEHYDELADQCDDFLDTYFENLRKQQEDDEEEQEESITSTPVIPEEDE